MTKNIFLITFNLLFFLGLKAQNVGQEGRDTLINYKDINGFKQGFWTQKYPNGNLKYEGFFFNDKPIGDFKRYDLYQNLVAHLLYDSLSKSATVTFYHKGNKVAATGAYYEKEKDKVWKYYSPSGVLYSQESFKKGKKHGQFLQFIANKLVIEEKNYKDGVEHGVWKKYFENGKLMWEANFVNGKLEGMTKTYYKNGKLHKEGSFKNDLMQGDWLIYNEDGRLSKVYHYEKGRSPEVEAEENKRLNELERNKGKIIEPQGPYDIDWLRGNY